MANFFYVNNKPYNHDNVKSKVSKSWAKNQIILKLKLTIAMIFYVLFYLCMCYMQNYDLFFTGCLGYTVYCEIGGEACLDFVKNNSLFTYAIKKNSSLVCLSTDRTTIYTFAPWEGKVNCTISSTKMSMCLGNFQSGDGGIFSLHKGSTDSSVLLSSIALVKASK